MHKNITALTCLFFILFLMNCAASKKTVLESPKPGKSLLVGAILVENVGLEDVYEARTANIMVVIVGRSEENGKEVTQGYRVKTNADGYYMIQNVPQGSYVIKGIEVDLGYETRMLVSSRWEGNTQFYYPENLMIDNTVRVWPPPSDQRVIDLQIRYFKSINNAQLALPDIRYTMSDPEIYFHEKYPEWGWFK